MRFGQSAGHVAASGGLLTEVVPAEEWGDRIQVWIDRIALRNADAVWLAKQSIDRAVGGEPEAGTSLAAQALLVLAQRRNA